LGRSPARRDEITRGLKTRPGVVAGLDGEMVQRRTSSSTHNSTDEEYRLKNVKNPRRAIYTGNAVQNLRSNHDSVESPTWTASTDYASHSATSPHDTGANTVVGPSVWHTVLLIHTAQAGTHQIERDYTSDEAGHLADLLNYAADHTVDARSGDDRHHLGIVQLSGTDSIPPTSVHALFPLVELFEEGGLGLEYTPGNARELAACSAKQQTSSATTRHRRTPVFDASQCPIRRKQHFASAVVIAGQAPAQTRAAGSACAMCRSSCQIKASIRTEPANANQNGAVRPLTRAMAPPSPWPTRRPPYTPIM
jgi:hypothetical protein